MTLSTEGTKIQSYLREIIRNRLKLNGNKDVTDSQINNIFNKLKFKFDENFDWNKLAQSVNNARKDDTNSSIFGNLPASKDDNSDETYLMQLFNAVMLNDEVYEQVDAGIASEDGTIKGKGDGKISADEMKTYFETLAAADKDAEDSEDYLTLSDFGEFFADKNSKVEKEEDKIDFKETADKTAEDVKKAEKAEKAEETQNAYNPGSTDPINPPGDSDGDQQQPPETEPVYKDKIDPDNITTARGKEDYINNGISEIANLANLNSVDLAKDLATGESEMSGMQNISKADREELQQAAAAKNTAEEDMNTKKEAASNNKSEAFEFIEKYQEAVKAHEEIQENVDSLTTLEATYEEQIKGVETSIESLNGSISSVEAQFSSLKAPSEDATDQEKIAYSNQKYALEAKLTELKNQKQALETQKNDLENKLTDTKNELDVAKQYLTEAEDAENKANEELEAHKNEMTQEEQDYLTSVAKYQEASQHYVEVKNKVMQHVKEDAQKQREAAIEKRKSDDANVNVPSLDSEDAQKTAKMLYEFEQLSENENAAVSAEAKAIYDKYNSLTPEQQEFLAGCFGSKNLLFGVLAATGYKDTEFYKDQNQTYTYANWLMDNVASFMSKLGDKPAEGYSDEKLQEVANSFYDESGQFKGDSETYAHYYLMMGIYDSKELVSELLASENSTEEDKAESQNTMLMINNYIGAQAASDDEEKISGMSYNASDAQQTVIENYKGCGIQNITEQNGVITLELSSGEKIEISKDGQAHTIENQEEYSEIEPQLLDNVKLVNSIVKYMSPAQEDVLAGLIHNGHVDEVRQEGTNVIITIDGKVITLDMYGKTSDDNS